MDIKNIQCPEALRHLKGWLVWSGNKIPYYISGSIRQGKNGGEIDRSRMVDFDTAKNYLLTATTEGRSGLGFALMEDFGITALDFDNCINPITGDIDGEVLCAIKGTYAEYSPSGNGVRAFVLGNLGDRKLHKTTDHYGFELFSTKGYVTYTGKAINPVPINEPNSDLNRLIKKYFGQTSRIGTDLIKPLNRGNYTLETLKELVSYVSMDASYTEWLYVGMALHYETDGDVAAFNIWDTWSASKSSVYTGRESLQRRWDSFGAEPEPVTGLTLARMARQNGYMLENDIRISDNDFTIINDSTESSDNSNLVLSDVPKKSRIISEAEFLAGNASMKWLVKGLLPQKSLAFLYGAPGSGKTFVTLDMCCAIATGKQWVSKKTTMSNVLYIAAEGASGLRVRLKAHRQYNPVSTEAAHIDFIHTDIPNLLSKKDVVSLIKDMNEQNKEYGLVVFDTLAQTTNGGDENTGLDMGKAIGFCQQLIQLTGATILFIHHSGKEAAKGLRGWSGLNGAADLVLHVGEAVNNDYRPLSIYKLKDGDATMDKSFRLKTVVLDEIDEDGTPVTSCLVEYADYQKNAGDVVKMSDIQLTILECMREFSLGSWVTPKNLIDLIMETFEDDNKPRKDNLVRSIDRMVGKFLEKNDDGNLRLL